MMLLKKAKLDINMKFVNDIVTNYFTILRGSNFQLNCSEISELLRHSMCRLLGLSSNGYTCKIEKYSDIVVESLSDVIKKYNLNEMTDEYKKGLLEACVHCMEMSRKKADN